MARELHAFWTQTKADPDAVCVIVTGAGERAFCTGMDIGDVADGSARSTGTLSRSESPWFKLTALHNRCWKPVITAVNGMACGGGLHFVADSDLVLCSETASFFAPT